MKQFGQQVIGGVITIIPLWITWLVVEFVFRKLQAIGGPIVLSIKDALSAMFPEFATQISWPLAEKLLAIVLTLAILYAVGRAVNHVFGRRLIGLVDSTLAKVPLVKTVHGGVRKLIATLQGTPGGKQNVVLINFPSEEMKTVGFLTKTMKDHNTGQNLAIVYVPTTPNPTSGYIEIVPMDRVVETDWTVDEAMNFIVSAGVIAPERTIRFSAKPVQLAEVDCQASYGTDQTAPSTSEAVRCRSF